jgi:serine/threonine protein kinase
MLQTPVFPERFRDPRLLARGGMGEVYVAEDSELARQVAVKVLDERLSADPAARQRFLREARAAAGLSGHPNVVTIFDVGESGDRPFIVMELLAGGTLAEYAREHRIPPEQATGWLHQIAAALDAAHAGGIVHRDVKPSNLLLDGRGEVNVADFGIARVVDQTTTGGLTEPGQVLGTAGYLSPEQALGREATAASDRYALAVVAYELLTGGRPFGRYSGAAEAAAHVNEPVPPASSAGGLPPEIDALFARALAKRPDDRYPSCKAFVGALERVLDIGSRAPDRARTLALYPRATHPRRSARRRRGRPLIVLLALLAAGAVGAIAAALLASGD